MSEMNVVCIGFMQLQNGLNIYFFVIIFYIRILFTILLKIIFIIHMTETSP